MTWLPLNVYTDVLAADLSFNIIITTLVTAVEIRFDICVICHYNKTEYNTDTGDISYYM